MRLAAVVLVAALASCGGGGGRAPTAAPAASDVGPVATTPGPGQSATASAASPSSPVEASSGHESPRPPSTAATASPAAAIDVPANSKCQDTTYRCTSLADALRWWAGKPALVPAGPLDDIRAMLHTASDPEVRTSTDAAYAPDFSYVLPDQHFPAMTRRTGGVSSAALSGGIVVRTYFGTERWLPEASPRSRAITVRGRPAILNEFRPSDGRTALRDVTWSVPHGDGTYVIWYVADDPRKRTESELVRLLNALVET